MVNEDSGTVSVCATILTPQERLSAPGYLIVFSIYTIPGTAESKLLELAELCMTWHLILLYAHTLLSLLPWLNNYTLTPLPIHTLTPSTHIHPPPHAHTHPPPHTLTPPLYTLTGQADYRGRTREEAIARPVLNGLVPNLPESCTDIVIVNDFDDSEGTEQLQLSLEFSTDNTNVNVEGCPANVTILDRRTYTSLSCTANCRQESTSSKNKNVKYCT